MVNYPIPEWQRRLHIVSETAAVIMVPVLWMASNETRDPYKTFLRGLAIGTLAVDGYLLYRWLVKNRARS
jgi:hypothetical protein